MGSSGLVVWRLGAGAGTHLTLGQQLGPWQGSLAASPPSAGPSCIQPEQGTVLKPNNMI